ncbi:MAG: hypothetical protein UY48_C0010G0026 [Candidatus Gottesmanbacteria bacterium GW2011_GWB1_49_7]|uniref:Uncharacterized protein n=1 Tax=Candidatus Gottesmanbacteria bacterium GW2011_GWB1_49_7 TaxID=1618448 RepID=A0A0G1Z1U6_9BACT|nr:MAG: hypothetical protein UY48_C0010G0026 [Candidatus Gottesmanbacteria bacterium GW2011_GWB1_49_7]
MKKIIGGKIYNTETADLVADENNDLHNFYSTTESLFRTKKGAWFLHGKSSAGGQYGKSAGNMCIGGQDIIRMTEKEVLDWASTASISDEETETIANLLTAEEA